jgi:amidase
MELALQPATRLVALVRRGRAGCVELLNHFIARAERFDPKLNAVVVRDFDRVRQRARALDRRRAKDADAPLLGVPMTVKESFDIAGLPTTWGHEVRRNHVVDEDALPVQRLKQAGAVVFGKTNVPVNLADWQSFNPVYGATGNPWNTDHTPGGSSGGGAATVVAGISGLELGSDIGGSVRVPAHYCGIFGHKPTWGLCPPRGHALGPPWPAAKTDISVIGPLARSAADLSVVLDPIGQPDPSETGLRIALPPPRARTMKGLRVAVWASEPSQQSDPETVALIEELARFLRRGGAKVSLTARPDFDPVEAYQVYLRALGTALSGRLQEDALARMRASAARRPAEDMSADAVIERSGDMLHRQWLRLNERRFQLRRAWGALFGDWDVLLCPAIATPAIPHISEDETWERRISLNGHVVPYNEMLFWPGLTCGFHLPASVAPIGQSKAGLPIGVQIAGPLYGDRTTLQVARLLEKEWRGFVAPPGYGKCGTRCALSGRGLRFTLQHQARLLISLPDRRRIKGCGQRWMAMWWPRVTTSSNRAATSISRPRRCGSTGWRKRTRPIPTAPARMASSSSMW